jgi:uncharacterized protein (TIGR03067 family)
MKPGGAASLAIGSDDSEDVAKKELAMMPSLIMLLGIGLLQDGDQKASEGEVRHAHQMLAGRWEAVLVIDDGDRIGPELIRTRMARAGQFTIANRMISHVNPETGESKSTAFLLNPVPSPRQIDLITSDDRMLPGIYKFDDDELVVCYTNRHGHGRPTDFASTGGSNRILMRLKVSEASAESKPAPTPSFAATPAAESNPPPGSAVRTHPVSLTRPLGEIPTRRPSESQLRVDRELLAGNWDILSIQDNGERLASDIIRTKLAEDGRVKIGVRGISIVSPRSEEKRLWAYRIDPGQTPKQIDITTQFDTVLKGIYVFNGDELKLCIAKTEDLPRPTAFEAPSGSNQILYRLKMGRPDPPPADEPKPQPPSPEELERRREQRIHDLVVGSWTMNDKKGSLVTIFRADGSFTATRTFAKKRLFEPDTATSSGDWSYGRGYLTARITGTTDRGMLGYSFNGRLQSIGDATMVATDPTGQLQTLRRLR